MMSGRDKKGEICETKKQSDIAPQVPPHKTKIVAQQTQEVISQVTMDEQSQKGGFALPRFSGSDYPVWKAQMEAILIAKGLGDTLKGTADESKEQVAKSLLLISLDNKHVKLILSCKTTKDIWERLSSVHEHKSSATKIMLQREFYELSQGSNERVHNYISRSEYVKSQLEDVGVVIDESSMVAKIVSGLNRDYNSFISNWMGSEESKQTIACLLPRLVAEEQLKFKGKKADTEALNVKSTDEQPKWKPRRKTNDEKSIEKSTEKSEKKSTGSGPLCFNCYERGHIKTQCTNQKVERIRKDQEWKPKLYPKSNTKSSATGNSAQALIAEANASSGAIIEWILDSGATEHMSFDEKEFSHMTKLDVPKKVLFGNDGHGYGVGLGDIQVTSTVNGVKHSLVLRDVLYVPEVRRKLLSLSAATSKGCRGTIEHDKATISNSKNEVILVAQREGNLYKVRLEVTQSEASLAQDELTLWHERFGHIGKSTVLNMSRSGCVSGIDKLHMVSEPGSRCKIDCDACAKGKTTRKTFPRSSKTRATSVGERLHADIGGPLGVSTIGGSKYYIIFKDENIQHIGSSM